MTTPSQFFLTMEGQLKRKRAEEGGPPGEAHSIPTPPPPPPPSSPPPERKQLGVATAEELGDVVDVKEVSRIVLLLSASKKRLTREERTILTRMHLDVWEYKDSELDDRLEYPDIKAQVVVIPLTDEGLAFFVRANRYIRTDAKTRVVMLLKKGEPSTPVLERKRVFKAHAVIKELPPVTDNIQTWLPALLEDVIPHLPGLAGKIARYLWVCM
jgi:hypothetical protein